LIEAQTQKLAIAEKDSVPAEMVLAALEKIRNMARQATKITMGLRKFARSARQPSEGNGSARDPGRNATLLHGKAETEFSRATSGPGAHRLPERRRFRRCY